MWAICMAGNGALASSSLNQHIILLFSFVCLWVLLCYRACNFFWFVLYLKRSFCGHLCGSGWQWMGTETFSQIHPRSFLQSHSGKKTSSNNRDPISTSHEPPGGNRASHGLACDMTPRLPAVARIHERRWVWPAVPPPGCH